MPLETRIALFLMVELDAPIHADDLHQHRC